MIGNVMSELHPGHFWFPSDSVGLIVKRSLLRAASIFTKKDKNKSDFGSQGTKKHEQKQIQIN